eukprot:4837889-Pleurochrysis_carterae.AAC.2
MLMTLRSAALLVATSCSPEPQAKALRKDMCMQIDEHVKNIHVAPGQGLTPTRVLQRDGRHWVLWTTSTRSPCASTTAALRGAAGCTAPCRPRRRRA